MFGRLLRKLGLGRAEAQIADTILEEVADRATGGAASAIEDAVEVVGREVKRRKAKKGV